MIRAHKDSNPASARRVIERLGMKKLFGSNFMYGADCPLCAGQASLVIWEDKAKIKCFRCGLEGEFRRAVERDEHDRNPQSA